jgi:excinuclease ABC subunit B
VSLVAILDADKEGFLRSDVTLIQTMGRAARHVEGEVILYADKITGSMQRAMDEVGRRRKIQVAENIKMGITPSSIQKPIREKLVEYTEDQEKALPWALGEKEKTYDSLPHIELSSLTPGETKKLIQNLKTEMRLAAQDLNFELAIEIRDKVRELETK